ncbi:PEGA domain-containing protein [bacterium]|nr:PEGA domain-containing protein [Porticoccaceae bacterium]MDC3261271.1 PEGA domain-containing protein [bacterium]
MVKTRNTTPLSATDFTPLEQKPVTGRRGPSPAIIFTTAFTVVAIAIMVFLFAARAIILRLDPAIAEVDLGGLAFHIGDNYLLLQGEHQLSAEAPGYYPLRKTIQVSGEATQEIDVVLQPLPGNLLVRSTLDDIQLSIDDQDPVTVPGTISEISRGAHKLEFAKYRYFTLQQEVEIEGLGKTQAIDISLQPAWGQVEFTTVPEGAELFIDQRLIGQTPLSAEVLETGSQLTLKAPGYKTLHQQVRVKAGSKATHPLIEMIVADGTLTINSVPQGASITIDKQFKGTSPMDVAVTPFAKHNIELFLEGYLNTKQSVSVKPEQQRQISVNLTPNIGRVRLNITPADAAILVDGKRLGTGSQTLSLNAKPQSISVEKSGYETQSMTVTPRPGHQQALTIQLLTLQQAYWASRPATIKTSVGGKLKLFQPDEQFMLGAPRRQPGRRANEAERAVRLERPFYLATNETTNGQFKRWKDRHSSTAVKGQTLDMTDQPVAKVSWEDAALFCNWLSRKDGLPEFYTVEEGRINGTNWDAHGYRLPTEAEWAWAAKVNSQSVSQVFPWANELYPPMQVSGNYADQSASGFLSFTLADYNDQYPVSAVVGSFSPNGKGLYDMSGNVAEWVNDYFDIRPNRSESEVDPRGPEQGSKHVIRGASWALASRTELRLSYRDSGTDGRIDLGFRIARYVDKPGGTL